MLPRDLIGELKVSVAHDWIRPLPLFLIACRVNSPMLLKLCFNPAISDCQTLFERNRGLPLKFISKAGIVAVPAAHALWFADIVTLSQGLAGDPADDVHEFVDGY